MDRVKQELEAAEQRELKLRADDRVERRRKLEARLQIESAADETKLILDEGAA